MRETLVEKLERAQTLTDYQGEIPEARWVVEFFRPSTIDKDCLIDIHADLRAISCHSRMRAQKANWKAAVKRFFRVATRARRGEKLCLRAKRLHLSSASHPQFVVLHIFLAPNDKPDVPQIRRIYLINHTFTFTHSPIPNFCCRDKIIVW